MRKILTIFFAIIMFILFSNSNGKKSFNLFRVLSVILFIILLLPIMSFLIFIFIVLFILYKLNIIKVQKTNFNDYYQNSYTFVNRNNENEYKKACDFFGVEQTQTYDEKRKKRNEMLKKFHPDFFDGIEKEKATEMTNKINNYWEIIKNFENKN